MEAETGWIPILTVKDAEASIKFYCEALGFEKTFEHRFGEGFPLYAGVRKGPLILHLNEHGNDTIEIANIYCVIKDVDALYEELVAKDIKVHGPPETQEWGMRDLSLRDPDGHELGFGMVVTPQD